MNGLDENKRDVGMQLEHPLGPTEPEYLVCTRLSTERARVGGRQRAKEEVKRQKRLATGWSGVSDVPGSDARTRSATKLREPRVVASLYITRESHLLFDIP